MVLDAIKIERSMMKNKALPIFFAATLAMSTLAGCGQAGQGQPANASAPTETATAGSAASEEQKDIQYVLYLGTNDKDTNEPVFSRDEAKEKAKEILIASLGGYTIQEAEGGWVSDDGTVYQEYTLVIYLSDTTEDKVHEVCDKFVETFRQSSVLIQKNVTETEFYAGANN